MQGGRPSNFCCIAMGGGGVLDPGFQEVAMYVYAIRARQYVKIGKANNPVERMDALQVGNPVELSSLFKLPCPSEKAAEQLEYVLHRMFKKFNSLGEWFEYGPIAKPLALLPACKTTDEMCSQIRSHFKSQHEKRSLKWAIRRGEISGQ